MVDGGRAALFQACGPGAAGEGGPEDAEGDRQHRRGTVVLGAVLAKKIRILWTLACLIHLHSRSTAQHVPLIVILSFLHWTAR